MSCVPQRILQSTCAASLMLTWMGCAVPLEGAGESSPDTTGLKGETFVPSAKPDLQSGRTIVHTTILDEPHLVLLSVSDDKGGSVWDVDLDIYVDPGTGVANTVQDLDPRLLSEYPTDSEVLLATIAYASPERGALALALDDEPTTQSRPMTVSIALEPCRQVLSGDFTFEPRETVTLSDLRGLCLESILRAQEAGRGDLLRASEGTANGFPVTIEGESAVPFVMWPSQSASYRLDLFEGTEEHPINSDRVSFELYEALVGAKGLVSEGGAIQPSADDGKVFALMQGRPYLVDMQNRSADVVAGWVGVRAIEP